MAFNSKNLEQQTSPVLNWCVG